MSLAATTALCGFCCGGGEEENWGGKIGIGGVGGGLEWRLFLFFLSFFSFWGIVFWDEWIDEIGIIRRWRYDRGEVTGDAHLIEDLIYFGNCVVHVIGECGSRGVGRGRDGCVEGVFFLVFFSCRGVWRYFLCGDLSSGNKFIEMRCGGSWKWRKNGTEIIIEFNEFCDCVGYLVYVKGGCGFKSIGKNGIE